VWFGARRGPPGVLGVLCATTPMVLAIGAVLNPSGLELGAAIAFMSGLMVLRRDVAGFSGRSWAALTVAGVTTMLAWQLGPAFVVLDVLLALLLLDRTQARSLLDGAGWGPAGLLAALVVAGGIWAIWGAESGDAHSTLHLTPIGGNLQAGLHILGQALSGAVGRFGAYDIPVPAAVAYLWGAVAAALALTALIVGRARERVAVIVAVLVTLAAPVLLFGFEERYTGFGVQARYVLPAMMLPAFVCAEVVAGHGGRALALLWRALIALLGVLELASWWRDATFFSGGAHLVFNTPLWHPPLGWGPWLAAAIAGAVAWIVAVIPARLGRKVTSPPGAAR
jgi:hypothetical protein